MFNAIQNGTIFDMVMLAIMGVTIGYCARLAIDAFLHEGGAEHIKAFIARGIKRG